MLANLSDVLLPARKAGYAVGLFNAVNLELARGIIRAAEKARSPVIIGTAEVLLPFGPLEDLAPMLVDMAKRATVPVVVHFDHGLSIASCERALRLGFTSVMLDASALPYEENVRDSREMVRIARSYGATVEAELGRVGNASDSAEGAERGPERDLERACEQDLERRPERYYTDPEQAEDFVSRTGVDALAVAVGTLHGTYRFEPRLDFDRISAIAARVATPLVLHGGSGLADEAFRSAIGRGISKVNVFTDINEAAAKSFARGIAAGKRGLTDLIPDAVSAVEEAVSRKLAVFGSARP